MTRKNQLKTPYGYPQYAPPQPVPYVQPYPGPYAQPPRVPDDVYNVSISVLSSHGATVAKVGYASVYNTGIPVTAAGSAKREPSDDYDPETGRLLATSRALEILAGKLRRRANGRIRHAETVKKHRAEARNRKPRPGEVTFGFKTAGPVGMATLPPAKSKKGKTS